MARRDGAFTGLKQKVYHSIDEACLDLGLDFDVELRKQRMEDDDGEYTIEVYDCQSVSRVLNDRRISLGSVGFGYRPVNYRQAFAIADPLVDEHGFKVVGGGAPNRGERGYLQIETGEEFKLGGTDVIRNRITMLSSHDGTKKIELRMTPYRPKSGTALTFDANHPLAFKHTLNVGGRIAASRKSLRRINEAWAEFTAGAKAMQTVKMSDPDARKFIEQVMPPTDGKTASTKLENIWEEIYSTYKTSSTIRFSPATKGTLFGLVQAFAEWADSREPRKSKKLDEVAAGIDMRLVSDGAKKKAKAWSLALFVATKGNKLLGGQKK